MPKQQASIEKTYDFVAGDVTAGSKIITEDFGGRHLIVIKSIMGYVVDFMFNAINIGVKIGNKFTHLGGGITAPSDPIIIQGPLEVEATGIWWKVERPVLGHTFSYKAIWEYLK